MKSQGDSLRCRGTTPDRRPLPSTGEPCTLQPPGRVGRCPHPTCFSDCFKPVQQLLQTSVICHRLPGVCQDITESREEPGTLWVHDGAGVPAEEMSGRARPHPPSHRQPPAPPCQQTPAGPESSGSLSPRSVLTWVDSGKVEDYFPLSPEKQNLEALSPRMRMVGWHHQGKWI